VIEDAEHLLVMGCAAGHGTHDADGEFLLRGLLRHPRVAVVAVARAQVVDGHLGGLHRLVLAGAGDGDNQG